MKRKVLSRFFHILSEKRLTTVAGAWVYYFLSSVIPLAFLIITAFGVFGVSITNDIVSRLPDEFRLAGQTIIQTAENASNGVTVFFILTVIFSCTTLLNQMSKDGDFIYGEKSKHKRGLLRRLWAIGALAVLFFLFLGVALLVAFGNMLTHKYTLGGIIKLLLTVLAFTVVLAVSYFIILLLHNFISPVRLKFNEIALGGFTSLCIVVIGTIGLTLYLKFFKPYNAFYGSLASIVVFLIWAYILMLGLAVGVVVNMSIYKRRYLTSKKP
ncbi:MAG: YihY/virulence factor BrkB family protein [Clostridia bacterium]|nr:YihY/virulence factor BrkB family protein [Clostridia bacterium]